jgi:mRNA-degrading endonuclease RelE of RelBE toxin-antitoxin system
MPSEPPQVRVEFTPEFKRNLRALSKKYRHIRSDVQPVLNNSRRASSLVTVYAGRNTRCSKRA